MISGQPADSIHSPARAAPLATSPPEGRVRPTRSCDASSLVSVIVFGNSGDVGRRWTPSRERPPILWRRNHLSFAVAASDPLMCSPLAKGPRFRPHPAVPPALSFLLPLFCAAVVASWVPGARLALRAIDDGIYGCSADCAEARPVESVVRIS